MPPPSLLPVLPRFTASMVASTSPVMATMAASASPTASPAASAKWSVAAAFDSLTEKSLASQLSSLLQTAASSSSSHSEKVLIAQGLPAIPKKLLQKMHNWEFIELGQLLPQSSSHDAAAGDTQRFALFPGFELVRANKKVITNVVDWVKCFSIYIAAMAQKYPEVTLPMLAYQLVIIKASQQYDGFYWRVYDTHYRVNAAATGNKNWS